LVGLHPAYRAHGSAKRAFRCHPQPGTLHGGNNTAQLAIDDVAVEAGRLGVPVSTINEPFFDSAGHLVQNTTPPPPPPPPMVTTYDNGDANNPYGVGSLAQVLSNVFLIPQGSAIAASVPAPGAWELVYGGGTPSSSHQAIAEVPDASGNAPSVLAFNATSGNFSVADWAGLQDVVLELIRADAPRSCSHAGSNWICSIARARMGAAAVADAIDDIVEIRKRVGIDHPNVVLNIQHADLIGQLAVSDWHIWNRYATAVG
jgi:hypothetical protein